MTPVLAPASVFLHSDIFNCLDVPQADWKMK